MIKNFISTGNFSREELEKLLNLAIRGKRNSWKRCLRDKVLAMLFMNPSLRTRVSFEVGMRQLGGHAINLSADGMWDLEHRDNVVMGESKAEHIKEAALVLSRYADAIAVRAFPKLSSWEEDKKDSIINGFLKYASVPVINMESSMYHPCQALADMMTIKERVNPEGKKFVLFWTYHPKPLPMAVPNSALLIASQFGMDVTIACPKDYGLESNIINFVKKNCKENRSNFEVVNDIHGLENADVVYAKSWGSLRYYGRWDKEKYVRNKLKGWIVDREKLDRTNNAKFMHCLPIRRNVEASDEVIDSKNSVIYDQAENRLHAQNALLSLILG